MLALSKISLAVAKNNLMLVLVALLWGIAFLFQREGMVHMGPLTFIAHRFLIATACLVLFVYFRKTNMRSLSSINGIKGGVYAGLILFFGSMLQQFSIQYTALANVAFITSLYVIIVPLMGIFLAHRYSSFVWIGGLIACTGLYFLSGVDSDFKNLGDILALIGAVFWAGHILVLGFWVKKSDPYIIALIQFFVCGLLSLISAFIFEDNIFTISTNGFITVLLCGVIVTAFAYSLQIVAQAKVAPFNASIIFSLESVFAAIAAYLAYQEWLSNIELAGCALILAGCIIAQYQGRSDQNKTQGDML